MTKRLAIFLVALLALGVTGAGCGDDEEDKSKEDAPAQTEGSGADKPKDDSGAKVNPDDPQVKQAIEQCKKQADANPQLSSEAKSKVGDVCEEAATGDADAAIKATKEACEVIVEDTAPAGSAKETALQACDKAGTRATP